MLRTAIPQGHKDTAETGHPHEVAGRPHDRERSWGTVFSIRAVQDVQNDLPARPQGAETEVYPCGTSQGNMTQPRTQLEAVFNILLVLADFRFGIHLIRR